MELGLRTLFIIFQDSKKQEFITWMMSYIDLSMHIIKKMGQILMRLWITG